jgi:hypothetical protein
MSRPARSRILKQAFQQPATSFGRTRVSEKPVLDKYAPRQLTGVQITSTCERA